MIALWGMVLQCSCNFMAAVLAGSACGEEVWDHMARCAIIGLVCWACLER